MSPAPKTGEHEVLPRGRSAAQVAYDYVKARLLDGRFAGGTLLSENEIAQRLNVSRTPVRQAFVQLEAEGLLELYPRRGALVVPISASEAEDVLEARQLIEQHAARRAAGAGPALARALREEVEGAVYESLKRTLRFRVPDDAEDRFAAVVRVADALLRVKQQLPAAA